MSNPITNRKGRAVNLHLIEDKVNCRRCNSQEQCIGTGLSDTQLNDLSKIIHTHGPYKPGDKIYRMEKHFRSLYAIQSGSVKVEAVLPDGTNLISGFYFSGELIGIESIGCATYGYDAIALQTTWVCELPFSELEALSARIPELQHEIVLLLGRKIRSTNDAMGHEHHLNSEQRIHFFLQDLCQRRHFHNTVADGYVELPMTKGDIACYLGLRPESFSRGLKKLEEEGVLRKRSKDIELMTQDTAITFKCK